MPGPTNEFERSLVFETGEFDRKKTPPRLKLQTIQSKYNVMAKYRMTSSIMTSLKQDDVFIKKYNLVAKYRMTSSLKKRRQIIAQLCEGPKTTFKITVSQKQ